MWTSSEGTETDDLSEFAEEIGQAAINCIKDGGGCTVSKTAFAIVVSDSQGRPQWEAQAAKAD